MTTPFLAYLLQRGVPRTHALGMLANIGAESRGDPMAVGDNGSSYGLFQHHGPRRDALFSHAGTRTPSAQQQIDYMMTEPETAAYLAQSFPDSRAAAEWFATHWERPKAEYLAQRKAGWQPGSVQDFEQRIMAQIPGAGPLLASTDEAPAYPSGNYRTQEAPVTEQPGLFEALASHPLFNMGMGVLASNTGHYGAFAPAFGRGVMLGSENYRRMQDMQMDRLQTQVMGQLRQAQAQAAQQKAAQEAAMAQRVEDFRLNKLPPHLRDAFAVDPEGTMKVYLKQFEPGQQKDPFKRYELKDGAIFDPVEGTVRPATGMPTEAVGMPAGYELDPDLQDLGAKNPKEAMKFQEQRNERRTASVSDQATLRKEYDAATLAHREVTRAAQVMPSLLDRANNMKSKVSDLALVVSLAKAMDPGSVVREGEVYTIQRTGGLFDYLNAQLAYVQNKGQMTPEMRRDIAETVMAYHKAGLGQANKAREFYRGVAQGYKANPDLITGPAWEEIPLPQGVPPPPPGYVPIR